MSILRTILFPVGSRLEIHTGGKKRYIPSPAYLRKRQEFMRKPDFKHTPSGVEVKQENCFKLLAAIFGYTVAKPNSPFKEDIREEASSNVTIWRD